MLLGQVKYSRRLPFKRPAQAGFYKPHLVPGAFYSHLNPFQQSTLPMPSFRANIPDLPRGIRPSVQNTSPMRRPFPTQPGPRPAVPTMATQVNGARFGNLGGVTGASPFNFLDTQFSRRMRTGAWMNVPSTARGVRQGVVQAGQLVQRMSPGSYPNAFRPAGGYRY